MEVGGGDAEGIFLAKGQADAAGLRKRICGTNWEGAVTMKNYLNYQTSDYDCGPTTLTNAIRFLFEREEILPELVKAISLYTLDAYNESGEFGKSGTSRMAMMFLSNWFNQFGRSKSFPITTSFLMDEQVTLKESGRIHECLVQGGVAIICCWLGEDRHYVLLTGMEGGFVDMFDPYDEVDFSGHCDIKVIKDEPKKRNRRVKAERIESDGKDWYAFGEVQGREAMLLFNTRTRLTPERTIEYMI